MGEKILKADDEFMKEVAGGINIPTGPRKFKVGDNVKSISNPGLGIGVVIDLGSLSGGYACVVAFDKQGEILLEDDLVLAD